MATKKDEIKTTDAAVASEVTEQANADHNAGFTTLEKADGELGEEQMQEATDEAEDKGYIGVKTDERPNEDYTVAGVLKNTQTS